MSVFLQSPFPSHDEIYEGRQINIVPRFEVCPYFFKGSADLYINLYIYMEIKYCICIFVKVSDTTNIAFSRRTFE